ncbi:VWA domain-containing protein [Dysgonomonas sp. 521]|uniref:carboxypeptidase-like regulatory domain-containing protein n=1 Tax=Dysgonomonas sp. 521 TaxID=2302932 RepID=UPI0013D1F71D|nr:carboxypeptidase-like regulatory domain-containing protein [Dysgonomonas sp. 521]NDV97329.1 VWA domain-containing protein [Dysgonomonas sp. 521]
MKKLLFFFSFLIISLQAISQDRTISGTLIDFDNYEPLIGVSVTVKGTAIGTVTDIDGKFSLIINDSIHKNLNVFYIGYKTLEVPITPASTYEIKMQEDEAILSEVVITAVSVKKEANTLAGKIAGVAISSATIDKKKPATTWKRSGMKDNSIRLHVGENDYIPLEAAQMAIQIDGFRVRVLMDCFFFNDKGWGLEGTFKLKLPTEATPYYFAFGETEYLDEDEEDEKTAKKIPYNTYTLEDFDLTFQGVESLNDREWSRVKEARIVSKQKAARAYEQTVSANIDPALMEWGGADMFSCRVYPLGENELHRVVIGYDLNMTEALDFREYILSLPQVERELKVDIMIHNSPLMQVSLSPVLAATEIDGTRTRYSLLNPKEKEIAFRYNNVQPVMLIQKEGHDEELDIPYFAATYRVDLPEVTQEDLPADAVFMLDVSVSSNPDKFNVWLKLMNEILNNNKDIIKRFAVLTFNIENRWYARHFQNNNYFNVSRFFEYANALALEGATDLASALNEASNPAWIKKDKRPKHIFLMSDADCNWGETNMHKLKSLINEGDRIHTYKTGLSGTNSAVLNYLSKVSGGFAFTVTGEEEALLTARSFRYKPWNIVNVEVEGSRDFLISGQPTQLYNGQKLIFTGRDLPTGNISIDVDNGTEKKRISYAAVEKINSLLASRVYGQIASSYLENYGYQAEEAAVNYSTYYKVPGQYTSFLMLESESDYDEYGIDDSEAKYFVDDNLVNDIVKKLEEAGATLLLGHDKTNFSNWLKKLEEGSTDLDRSEEFDEYINNLPDDIFSIKLKPQKFGLFLAEQQTEEEKTALADEDVRFDRLFEMTKERKSMYSKADALKLLSSVVERNASDVQAIRDVAMSAIEWNMGDHAYYMMRRIIDWREGEALSYLTAAEALAKSGYVDMSLIYYYICLNADWDSDYGDFETITALKCQKYLNELSNSSKIKLSDNTKAFITHLTEKVKEELSDEGLDDFNEADIVVIVSWNINDTDIDLHIVEPTGEKCYYGNNKTEIGGKLSIDVTSGYGPEMYVLKKAVKGKYSVLLDYYSDSGTQTASKAKAYIDIYRNWGRKNESVTRKVVQLRSGKWDDYNEDEDKRNTVMTFNVK